MTSAGLVAEQARLLPVEAVMAQLGVGRSTVFELFSSQQLRSVKIGRRRLVPQSAVDDFVAKLIAMSDTVGPSDDAPAPAVAAQIVASAQPGAPERQRGVTAVARRAAVV